MNYTQLRKILYSHKCWIEDNASGQRADLRNANLSGLDLSWVNLTGADLSGCNLQRTNFRNAVLLGTDLSGSDLRRASLGGTDLTNANLKGALLTNAHLYETCLANTDLPNTGLKMIKMPKDDIIVKEGGALISIGQLTEQVDIWVAYYKIFLFNRHYTKQQINLYGQKLLIIYNKYINSIINRERTKGK